MKNKILLFALILSMFTGVSVFAKTGMRLTCHYTVGGNILLSNSGHYRGMSYIPGGSEPARKFGNGTLDYFIFPSQVTWDDVNSGRARAYDVGKPHFSKSWNLDVNSLGTGVAQGLLNLANAESGRNYPEVSWLNTNTHSIQVKLPLNSPNYTLNVNGTEIELPAMATSGLTLKGQMIQCTLAPFKSVN